MRRRVENPCERCGFNVTSADRHGDPLPQHTYERDCFRAVYEAAVEEAKAEITKAMAQHTQAFVHRPEQS